jgi:hypothetical protein
MENSQTETYSLDMKIPNQTEINKIRTQYIEKRLNFLPESKQKDTILEDGQIDESKLIWVGELELSIIFKLLETYKYCCQTQQHSGGMFRLIYRYFQVKNINKVEIPKKPAITLKTIKKRTDFYVSYNELPLSMELDFEKIKYKNRLPKWRWLGDPKDYTDLTRLGNYVIEIFNTPLNLNEF